MRFLVAPLVIGNFLTIIIEGFQVTSRNRNRNISRNQHDRISFDDIFRKTISTSTSTSATTTCLKMVDKNSQDPDTLLKMVEELTMDEITPEIVSKMEKVEIALGKFSGRK